jgi:hypothetical protein
MTGGIQRPLRQARTPPASATNGRTNAPVYFVPAASPARTPNASQRDGRVGSVPARSSAAVMKKTSAASVVSLRADVRRTGQRAVSVAAKIAARVETCRRTAT